MIRIYSHLIIGYYIGVKSNWTTSINQSKEIGKQFMSFFFENLNNRHEYNLSKLFSNNADKVTIGRGYKNDIDITSSIYEDREISRKHATLNLEYSWTPIRNIGSMGFRDRLTHVTITDTKSTNGTWLNNRKLKADIAYKLKPNDIVTMGKISLRFVKS